MRRLDKTDKALKFSVPTCTNERSGAVTCMRSRNLACADGEACGQPLPNRLVKAGLIAAAILVVAALGFDFVAPLFLSS